MLNSCVRCLLEVMRKSDMEGISSLRQPESIEKAVLQSMNCPLTCSRAIGASALRKEVVNRIEDLVAGTARCTYIQANSV